MTMASAMSGMTGGEKPKGRLRALKPKGPDVPVTDDPRAELRRLVRQHRNLTKSAIAISNMRTDKLIRVGPRKGQIDKCPLPDDIRADMQVTVKAIKAAASALAASMTRELRKLPIWTEFLSKMYGMGPVVGAYLVAEIDISVSTKISQLRRFCGLAVIDGRLEWRQAGQKSQFNAQMRTRLFQLMTGMWKNAAAHVDKVTGEVTRGSTTTKYLEVWRNAWHRGQHDERFDAGANTWGDRKAGKMIILRRAMWKACDVLLEDLYIVWRTLEGLDVWPSYYTAKLTAGYEHGGSVAKEIGPRKLTLDEALALVGDVGGRPAVPSAVSDLSSLKDAVDEIEAEVEEDEADDA